MSVFRNTSAAASRLRIPFRALIALAACPIFSASAHAACTPPPALNAKIKAHPTADAYADLGNWYGDHQQFPCAQDAFHSALRLDPQSARLNYLYGLSLYESHSFDDAVAPLRQSIQSDSTVIKPHLILGAVLTQLNQLDEAEAEFRAALAIDSASSIALHGLVANLMVRRRYADVIDLLQPQPHLEDDFAADLATAYARSGMQEEGIDTLTKALDASPSSLSLANALVALELAISRTLDAEHVAEKSYNLHPDDVSAQTSYLRTLVLNGDWTTARPIGAKLLAEAPHAFDTLYLNGVMERQAGDFAAARDHLTEAVSLNPEQANARANLGIALSRLHDLAAAKDQLERAIALGKVEPETHFELASVLRQLGDAGGAKREMALYQQAVRDNNNNILAISKAGEAAQALKKGETQDAVSLYKEAFAAAPKNALIGYKLATTLDQSGDIDGERAVLQQVVALDPTIALAQNQLGYLESRRGDYPAAEEHFRQAVASAPEFTQAWISLAATLGMESKFPEAQRAVASALRIDPQNAQARQLSHDLADAQNQHHN